MWPVRAANALLMPSFALPRAPAGFPADLHRSGERSPTALLALAASRTHGVGAALSPVSLSAPSHSTSELLRTLSRVAASGPTSWLSGQDDRLSHYRDRLGDLSRWSGLFPSRRRSFAPAVSLHAPLAGIRGLVGVGKRCAPSPIQAPYLQQRSCARAEPQSISGRTSYLRVRLAFHPYPQLIRAALQR